uniref:Fibroblast growth factor n=1 Tax=Gasterosteus aculeatus aculeatus TaxID=481459 RepID=A0AAQ4Q1P3_GASAC
MLLPGKNPSLICPMNDLNCTQMLVYLKSSCGFMLHRCPYLPFTGAPAYFLVVWFQAKRFFGCRVKLQIQATSVGEVVIKGVCANRYLAMNRDGRLFGVRRATDECYFLERLESNNYNTYRSRKYPGMYVALKRTGQYKSGSKTGPGQKAILFLPMSAKC